MSFDDPFATNNTLNDDNAENNFYNFNDEDSAAEFLEREKRELSDITGNGNASPFEDPFNEQSSNHGSLTNGAHSPALQADGSISPDRSNPSTNGSQYQVLSQLDEQMNEPEKIRKWREEFSTRIEKKDADEDSKRKEMQEQAKKELDDFYKQRVEHMERTRGQNRSNNHAPEDDLFNDGSKSNGHVDDWDKITSLCEFNPKTNRSQKDLTRYRSVLLQLKQQHTSAK